MAPVRRQLPTKYVNPGRLSIELKHLLGDDTILKVQVRHNVYVIQSSKDFDLDVLYENCRKPYGVKPLTRTVTEDSE